MTLLFQWGIPLVCLALVAFAFFAPRKEDRGLPKGARAAIAPGSAFRVTVPAAFIPAPAEAPAAPHESLAEIEPVPDRELDPSAKLQMLQSGVRDVEMLRDLLSDPTPATRSAALDIALAWHDLDAVASAINDPIVPIAARAALEYRARTSAAACEAQLVALDPEHAEHVRERLALVAF
jgi:hypothetical protein